MLFKIGHVYRFEFDDPFTDLGWVDEEGREQSGYYQVVKSIVHERMLEEGLDPVQLLYALVGLGETEYQAHKDGYVGKEFLQLKDMNQDDVYIYMPVTHITQIPLHDVVKRAKVMLATKLGIIDDDNVLQEIQDFLEGFLKWKYGLTAESTLMTYDYVWTSGPEYQVLLDEREAARGLEEDKPIVLGTVTHPMNLFAEVKRLQADNIAKQTKITALETFISEHFGS